MRDQINMMRAIEQLITEQVGDSEMHLMTKAVPVDDYVVLEITCFDNGAARYFRGLTDGRGKFDVDEMDPATAKAEMAEWE